MTVERRYCLCGSYITVSVKGDDASKAEVIAEWESWHSDHHEGHGLTDARVARNARRRNERKLFAAHPDEVTDIS